MDMVQYDCPYIAASETYDVEISGVHWDFDTAAGDLETRVMVAGADRDALDNALDLLGEHETIDDHRLLACRDEQALVNNRVEATTAMRTIRNNDGYLTGPFKASNGSECWHVGFDREKHADRALSELDRNNDFTVESRNTLSFAEYFDVIENVDTSKEVLDAIRALTDTERETLVTAMESGYFETPRDATVTDLASEFDVSTTGFSKNIRRGERKLLSALVDALDDVNRE